MPRTRRLIAVALTFVMAAAIAPFPTRAQDWKSIETEALETLRRYVRINTAVPPGDVSKAADFLQSILEREGIPVTRYESGPGRSIIVARLKGTGPAKPASRRKRSGRPLFLPGSSDAPTMATLRGFRRIRASAAPRVGNAVIEGDG